MFLADFIAEKPFSKNIPLKSFEHDTLAANFYDQWKEVSYSKNKNCFGISEQNGTTCRYVQVKIQKFIKIRITLPDRSSFCEGKGNLLSFSLRPRQLGHISL